MRTLNAALGVAKPGPSFTFAQRPKVRAAIAPSQLRIGNWKWSLLAALLLAPVPLFAQQYSIDWYKVAGGGGTSTGATYQVTSTIGQPDASIAMSGGQYSLTGGFWSLYAVQTPGAPYLWVTRTPTNTVCVWWTVSPINWQLQATTGLVSTGSTWKACSYTTNGANCVYIESPPVGNRFYRLRKP